MTDHAHGKRLGHGDLIGEDFEEGLGHLVPLSTLRNVFLTLVFLTVLTVVASRFNFGHWNIVIALVIATVKATIVATFFMHLKFEGKTIIMYVFYPLILLFLFIGGSISDVATRGEVRPLGVPEKLPQPKIVGPHVEGESEAAGAEKPADSAHKDTAQTHSEPGHSE